MPDPRSRIVGDRCWRLVELWEPRNGIVGGSMGRATKMPLGSRGGETFVGESFEDRPTALQALSIAQAQGRKVRLRVAV